MKIEIRFNHEDKILGQVLTSLAFVMSQLGNLLTATGAVAAQGRQMADHTIPELKQQIEALNAKADKLVLGYEDLKGKILATPGITPEQQQTINDAFDEVTSEAAKIDTTLAPDAPPATPTDGSSA